MHMRIEDNDANGVRFEIQEVGARQQTRYSLVTKLISELPIFTASLLLNNIETDSIDDITYVPENKEQGSVDTKRSIHPSCVFRVYRFPRAYGTRKNILMKYDFAQINL